MPLSRSRSEWRRLADCGLGDRVGRLRALGGLLAIVAIAALLFAGVFALHDIARGRNARIVVGSKAFSESVILGEIIAQMLEARSGARVDRRHHLGGTQVCFQALRSGALDVYPEYTGTGLVAILMRPAITDPEAVLGIVRREFASRYGLQWTEPLGFENTYAIAVPRRVAQRFGLRRISDLRGHADLSAGFATEFLVRGDGYPGLAQRYGLRFDHAPRSMEAGLMYRAAAEGQIDVISAYATDGRIVTMDFVVLDDDRHFFPPYQAVPLARRDTLARHPLLRSVLRALAGAIDSNAMRRMNADVDSGRAEPADVARRFIAGMSASVSRR